MKKIALTSLLIILGIFLVTGCGSKRSATISVSLKGATHIASVKKGDTLSYTIMNEDYVFEIVDITDDEVKIKTNKDGLTSSGNLSNVEKEFTIKKGEGLTLYTQTTDYQESVHFSY